MASKLIRTNKAMVRGVLLSKRFIFKFSCLVCLLSLCWMIRANKDSLQLVVAPFVPNNIKSLIASLSRSPTMNHQIHPPPIEVVQSVGTGATNLSQRITLSPRPFMSKRLTFDLIYQTCNNLLPPPNAMERWPEEAYIHDPKITDVREIADPTRSLVWNDGKAEVRIGDTVRITVELFDGFGKRKTKGGDLVRVWIREPSLGASATASVTDNQDGSYSAILTAFWEGKPMVRAAIISPREVIATQFRRRYICPPVLLNTAIFHHPTNGTLIEETPCSYDPKIPGYRIMCNLTSLNGGSPWYCGKPSLPGLRCQDWSMVADRNLVKLGHDQVLLTDIEKHLLSAKYKAMIIPTKNLTITVIKDKCNTTRLLEATKCHEAGTALSWPRSLPSGYLYNRKWTDRHCSGSVENTAIKSCLQNTRVVLIGDSTVRQMYEVLKKKISCTVLSEAVVANKSSINRPESMCINRQQNSTLEMKKHVIPMCLAPTPRALVNTFEANLNLISNKERTILLIHTFAHFLNYHSHVFYEILQSMKRAILKLLQRKPDVIIVIKGPAAFSFAKDLDFFIWKPDAYAGIYQQYMTDVFSDLKDRIVFLNCLDITVSTEQWHIHPEDMVVDALVDSLLSHVCPN